MSATSSAIPQNLIRFGEQAAEIDDHLLALAGPLQDALDAFRASASDFAPPIPEVDETLRQLARRGRAMDDRVALIGRAFRDAAHGRLARPDSVNDALLLPVVPARGHAGSPTSVETSSTTSERSASGSRASTTWPVP